MRAFDRRVALPWGEADDGPRTRDLWLGKPTLYQLSYVRAAIRPDSTRAGPDDGVSAVGRDAIDAAIVDAGDRRR